MEYLIFTIMLYILSLSLETECILTRRLNYDAVLYEEFSIDSKSVQFSRTNKEMWKNLTSLMENNAMEDESMLCTRGKGSWFGFPGENYTPKGLRYLLIVGENCFPAKQIRSLEPVGDIRRSMINSIIFFTLPHFTGEQQIMSDKDDKASFDAQSLVIIGMKEYLVEGAGPDGPMKICLKPQKEMEICIMNDLDASLGMAGPKSFTAQSDCGADDDTVKLVYMDTCYDEGTYGITHDEDMSPKNMRKMCTETVEQPIKNDMGLIMEVFDARVRRQLQGRDPISLPSEANFKVMLFNTIMDVFEDACDVDKEYIGIFKTVFLMRMRTIWDQDKASIGIEDEKWKETMTFLETCHAGDKAGARTISATPCDEYINAPRGMAEGAALEEMMNGDDFDPIIDQVWMIFEMVIPYCNSLNEYDDNKWAEMQGILRRYFLGPLKNQWRFPHTWKQLYPTMFHGFDMETQKMKIISCVNNLLKRISATDPIGRNMWALENDQNEQPMMKARKIL